MQSFYTDYEGNLIMSANILTAISNIVNNRVIELGTHYVSRNRANNMGVALENYIMDIFANTIQETDERTRLEKFSQVFSYQGNQNNPPDMIIRNGDAIEVKKIESKGASLPLNSSYPKAKLFANNSRISDACRECENWQEKDIIYATGFVKNNILQSIFFVYGIDYAARAETYERYVNAISTGVTSIQDVEFAETNELGRVNRVDPLGITNLRIRGMWEIKNPVKVFDYIYTPTDAQFSMVSIINTEKFLSFPENDRLAMESLIDDGLCISDVRIMTPDNRSIFRDAKLITFSI